jgi:hypothetical protein
MVNTHRHGALYGPAAFAARCDELAQEYGERFEQPGILRRAVANSELFQ